MRKQFVLITFFVLLLRLPLLQQPMQGDDLFYLYGAEHAQIDPLHPTHARYLFQGVLVDMRGHPHPPFDSWYLGALLAALGTVEEVAFHLAYVPFSLLAAWSALALARRFCERPLAATLMFLVTPAFVVNGSSLESDVPFVAFWLTSIAFYVAAVDRGSHFLLALATIAMALASLTAYQAAALTPILLLYGRRSRPASLGALTPLVVIAAFQLFERASSGALPATVLAGYMQSYGLQKLMQKLLNTAALLGHLGWIVFPVLAIAALRQAKVWQAWPLIPVVLLAATLDKSPLFLSAVAVGAWILLWCLKHFRDFISQWILIFFAAALVIFFAGSARYLLPIALPVCILVASRAQARWLYLGVALELLVSLGLAVVNYQHWDGYRQFARRMSKEMETERVWINGDFLRFYFEQQGALPLPANRTIRPGDVVVSSRLSARRFNSGGALPVLLASQTIGSSIPLRLAGLESNSAYSTTAFGLQPFDVSKGLIDELRAERFIEKMPALSMLEMKSADAGQQIISGVYDVESGQWRWMGDKAVILLKPSSQTAPLRVTFYIPPQAPARVVTVSVDSRQVAQQRYATPGPYTLITSPIAPHGASTSVTITVDRTFSVPNDNRVLGVILSAVGFESN